MWYNVDMVTDDNSPSLGCILVVAALFLMFSGWVLLSLLFDQMKPQLTPVRSWEIYQETREVEMNRHNEAVGMTE